MKVFNELEERFVDASEPHAPETQYRIAYGFEVWEEQKVWVYKVQMAYGGKVAGRRSPSYPVGTDDWERVRAVLDDLKSEIEQGGGKHA